MLLFIGSSLGSIYQLPGDLLEKLLSLSFKMEEERKGVIFKEDWATSTRILLLYCALSLSYVWLFASLWTMACQDPLSMWFSRQEYWSGLPFPSPEYLSISGAEPRSPHCRWALYHLSHRGGANTGMGSLSLLQANFPTQESNQDLLLCRWILSPAELPGEAQYIIEANKCLLGLLGKWNSAIHWPVPCNTRCLQEAHMQSLLFQSIPEAVIPDLIWGSPRETSSF